MKGVENNYRSQLGDDPLSSLMKIIIDGKPYAEHDSTKVVKVFLQQKKWKNTYAERRRSCNQSTNEDLKSKKS